jgi:hypothetical protein
MATGNAYTLCKNIRITTNPFPPVAMFDNLPSLSYTICNRLIRGLRRELSTNLEVQKLESVVFLRPNYDKSCIFTPIMVVRTF